MEKDIGNGNERETSGERGFHKKREGKVRGAREGDNSRWQGNLRLTERRLTQPSSIHHSPQSRITAYTIS
jgi:hypothetical protein